MNELETLKKQLAIAKIEILDLQMRLKNAEFLYWQLLEENSKVLKPKSQK